MEALLLLWVVWLIIWIIQLYLGLGTAYRHTKRGGDNGFALFGWLFLFELAALVPGLGWYFWKKSFDGEKPSANPNANPNEPANSQLAGSAENWTRNPENWTRQPETQQSTSLNDGAFTNPTDNERQG